MKRGRPAKPRLKVSRRESGMVRRDTLIVDADSLCAVDDSLTLEGVEPATIRELQRRDSTRTFSGLLEAIDRLSVATLKGARLDVDVSPDRLTFGSLEWRALQIRAAVGCIREALGQGDAETALLAVYALGQFTMEDTLVKHHGPTLAPALRARQRAAETNRRKAHKRAGEDRSLAARLWSDDPHERRGVIVAEATRAGKRAARTLRRTLPKNAAEFMCHDPAGIPRTRHTPDRDGRCIFCRKDLQ